jgi:hypothetical protein
MATAESIAKRVIDEQVALLDAEIEKLDAQLKKYEPLMEARDRLKAARRSMLAQRSTTANGGGRVGSTSQAEIIDFLRKNPDSTAFSIAQGVGGKPDAIRAQLNRGVGERFTNHRDNGEVKWALREPKNDDPGEDDEE